MKTQICYFFIILLIGCGQTKKESSTKESSNKPSDTLVKLTENQIEKSEKYSFHDLDSALLFPEKVIYLTETYNYRDAKHLPSQIGLLVNLRTLQLACMEKLEDLPVEIGQLKNLERLIINNGNGCVMNITIPSSIGQLHKLMELNLYGALDGSYFIRCDSINKTVNPLSIIKKIPDEIGQLTNLEILDLGRNRIDYFPPQIENLVKLRILRFEYSNIKEIPSYISKLKNLEEIDIRMNGRVILPNSLGEFKKLKMLMGDCELTLKDQAELRKRFPNITFDFENEYVQGSNEQESR